MSTTELVLHDEYAQWGRRWAALPGSAGPVGRLVEYAAAADDEACDLMTVHQMVWRDFDAVQLEAALKGAEYTAAGYVPKTGCGTHYATVLSGNPPLSRAGGRLVWDAMALNIAQSEAGGEDMDPDRVKPDGWDTERLMDDPNALASFLVGALQRRT